MATEKVQAVYDALVSGWQQRAPWYRRITARFGLQGKLTACFFALIIGCCVLNCWMFARQSGRQLNELMGEQARQVCSTLALTSETRIRNDEWDELTQTAQQLIKSRNI